MLLLRTLSVRSERRRETIRLSEDAAKRDEDNRSDRNRVFR